MADRVDIVRPLIDKREYGVVTLDNGLQALLISDKETDKGAAALDVGTAVLAYCFVADAAVRFIVAAKKPFYLRCSASISYIARIRCILQEKGCAQHGLVL